MSHTLLTHLRISRQHWTDGQISTRDSWRILRNKSNAIAVEFPRGTPDRFLEGTSGRQSEEKNQKELLEDSQNEALDDSHKEVLGDCQKFLEISRRSPWTILRNDKKLLEEHQKVFLEDSHKELLEAFKMELLEDPMKELLDFQTDLPGGHPVKTSGLFSEETPV